MHQFYTIWLKSAVQYTLPLWTVAYIEQLILIRLQFYIMSPQGGGHEVYNFFSPITASLTHKLKDWSGSSWEDVKVAHGLCFALTQKSSKELLLLFTYVISLCKVIPIPSITKFKSNRSLSNLSINRTPIKMGSDR